MYWQQSITVFENHIKVLISFAYPGTVSSIEKTFDFPEEAARFVIINKRQWLIYALEKWVSHKRNIIEANKDLTKHQALKDVLTCLEVFSVNRKSLETICQTVVRGENKFRAIMPSVNNTSYNSSLEKLNYLIDFCKNEITAESKAA
jgi:hypothetical protein